MNVAVLNQSIALVLISINADPEHKKYKLDRIALFSDLCLIS
jgi:hypothetical protein